MLRHHLRTTLRRLRRQKGYTAVNVLGLGVGLAVCGVILLFVRHETSYEAFHEHADRIHLLHLERIEGGEIARSARIPFGLAEAIRESVPGIEEVVRSSNTGELRVVDGGEVMYLNDLYHVDPEIFDVFTFPLVAGDPVTALRDPQAAVIDETLAVRLFGVIAPQDAVGRTFTNRIEWEGLEYDFEYTVSGVMRDIPANTHWRPQGFVSISTLEGHPSLEVLRMSHYLLFEESFDPQSVDWSGLADRPVLRRASLGDGTLYTRPIHDIHLRGRSPEWGLEPGAAAPPIVRVRIFAGVALLILLLAGVNYVSMATALGLARTRSIGVQRTIGSGSWRIASEFLVEAVVLAIAAALLAAALIVLLLPAVSNLIAPHLEVSTGEAPLLVGFLAVIAVVVGLVAGAYPAIVLARTRPVDAFRGSMPSGIAGAHVQRGLVAFQIGAFVILIVAAQVMRGQLAFMQEHDLGFEPDQILVIDARHAQDRTATLRELLSQHPGVLSAATGPVPGEHASRTAFPRPGSEEELIAITYFASPYFLETIGAELVAGNPDDTGPPRGNMGLLYLNESAVAALGWAPKNAVDRELYGEPVHGVVRDFHHESLHAPVEPMMIYVRDGWPQNRVLVRFQTGEVRTVLAAAETAWREIAPGDPLTAFFLDDRFAQLYDSERRTAAVMRLASLVAILVAGMGLFALAAFAAQRRRREVAIRKVVGASIGRLMALLCKDFLVLLALAFAIGAPVAYWLMSRWLDGFAYNIDIGTSVFAVTLLGAVAVVLGAVGYHALRAATADPVEAIRSE